MRLSVLTLEFLQWLGISIRKPSFDHKYFPGDCHQCQLKSLRCPEVFGPVLPINDLLPLIPMALIENFALTPSPEQNDPSKDFHMYWCECFPFPLSGYNGGEVGRETFEEIMNGPEKPSISVIVMTLMLIS